MNSNIQSVAEKSWRLEDLPSTCGPFRPIALRVCNSRGVVTDLIRSSEPFYIELKYRLTAAVHDFRVQFKLYTALGEVLFMTSDTDDPARHKRYLTRHAGEYISRCHIPANLLNKGVFVVGFSATIPNVRAFYLDHHIVRFSVDETGGVGSNWIEDRGGFFRPALDWEIEEHPRILAAAGG
jgi:lipopolysaccharide transport system ATP-binding protein